MQGGEAPTKNPSYISVGAGTGLGRARANTFDVMGKQYGYSYKKLE